MKAYINTDKYARIEIPFDVAIGLNTGDCILTNIGNKEQLWLTIKYKWYVQHNGYGEPTLVLNCEE